MLTVDQHHLASEPCTENDFLGEHAQLLLSSFQRLTGRVLLDEKQAGRNHYRALFEAPFGLVSHNTAKDPIFNYANQTALKLFEMNWFEFTRLPSRLSAEPVKQQERDTLLQRVIRYGYIDDYKGVRISASGTRFMIEEAIVWNLIDDSGVYCGQAAALYKWSQI